MTGTPASSISEILHEHGGGAEEVSPHHLLLLASLMQLCTPAPGPHLLRVDHAATAVDGKLVLPQGPALELGVLAAEGMLQNDVLAKRPRDVLRDLQSGFNPD